MCSSDKCRDIIADIENEPDRDKAAMQYRRLQKCGRRSDRGVSRSRLKLNFDDRVERFSGHRVCRTNSDNFFREWAGGFKGKEFRISFPTAGNGSGRSAGAGRRATSSGSKRAQASANRSPISLRRLCLRLSIIKSDRLDHHDQPSGTAQGYSDL